MAAQELPDGELPDGRISGPVAGAAGSLALRDIPIPDYCDVVIVPTAGVDESDPRVWADAIFSYNHAQSYVDAVHVAASAYAERTS